MLNFGCLQTVLTLAFAVGFGESVRIPEIKVTKPDLFGFDDIHLNIGLSTPRQPSSTKLESSTSSELQSEECKGDIRNVPLVAITNGPLNYTAGFYLISVRKVEDVQESLTVFANFYVKWKDHCLAKAYLSRLQDNDGDVIEFFRLNNHFYLDADDYWRPPIIQVNGGSLKAVHSKRNINHQPAIVLTESGLARQDATGEWTARCPFSHRLFPFDNQLCSFIFEMQTFVDMATFVSVETDNIDEITGLGRKLTSSAQVWDVTNVSARIYRTCYTMVDNKEHCMAGAAFDLMISRKWMPYLFSIFIPSSVLIVLMLATFGISPHLPDRPVFAITIILAMAILQVNIAEAIPDTAEPIMVILYININIILGTLLSVYTAIMVGVAEHFHLFSGSVSDTSLEDKLPKKVIPSLAFSHLQSQPLEMISLRSSILERDEMFNERPIDVDQTSKKNLRQRTFSRKNQEAIGNALGNYFFKFRKKNNENEDERLRRLMLIFRCADSVAFCFFVLALLVEHAFMWSLLR